MENEERKEKETGISWFNKHADTLVILGSFAVAFWTLNEKISSIEKDLAIVKTVLIMKNIMPQEVCKNIEAKEQQK